MPAARQRMWPPSHCAFRWVDSSDLFASAYAFCYRRRQSWGVEGVDHQPVVCFDVFRISCPQGTGTTRKVLASRSVVIDASVPPRQWPGTAWVSRNTEINMRRTRGWWMMRPHRKAQWLPTLGFGCSSRPSPGSCASGQRTTSIIGRGWFKATRWHSLPWHCDLSRAIHRRRDPVWYHAQAPSPRQSRAPWRCHRVGLWYSRVWDRDEWCGARAPLQALP